MALQFRFEFDEVDDIPPWGEGEDRKLHWFGLTSGRNWISTPLGEALRYTDEQIKLWELPSPYVDYQISRLFEDVQYALPAALEPVPFDVAATVSDGDWFERAAKWIDSDEDKGARSELYYDAMDWYQIRSVDSMHLINGPIFHFWRVEDDVTMRWEPTGKNWEGVWSVPAGTFTVSAEEFGLAAYAFLDDVLRVMQLRVDAIQTTGWNRSDCKLDIPHLVKEQRERAAAVSSIKQRRVATDWNSVRGLLQRIAEEY